MQVNIHDLIYTMPLWSLALFSVVLLLIKAIAKNKEMRKIIVCLIAFLGFCVSGVGLIWTRVQSHTFLFDTLLRLDPISEMVTYLMMAIGMCTLPLFLAKKNHVVSDRFFSEYIFLFMNSILGLLLLAWSNHLIVAFVAVEHFSLCFYLMIPLARDRLPSMESALKYFVLGSVAACIFALGIAMIYASNGALDFVTLLEQSKTLVRVSRFFLLGVSFVCIAALFKIAIFPFQFWLPDVYQGSATPLAGFMASAVKISVFLFFLRFLSFSETIVHSELAIASLFQWLAIGSILVGNISALMQKNLKRMLIYSSIAHAGYMMMIFLNIDVLSIASLIYYLIFYGMINFGAMATLMFFEKDQITGVQVDDLKGLSQKRMAYSFVLTWFLLNLAGLPPTAGFFAKVFIFESLVGANLLWMLFWAVIGSAIGLFYYLRPIVKIYTPSEGTMFKNNEWVAGCVIILFIFSILLVLFTGHFYTWIIQHLLGG